ncbi:MAG: Secretion system C-terminal sorting domain [Bacteroidota bacterium]
MKNVLLTVFLGLSALLNAQNYLNQVLVVNEGYYDYATSTIVEPVTVGVYNPSTDSYALVNTIAGMRFASDAIIAGDAYYVAADQKILKYDLNSHALLAETTYPGVRNLAFVNGKIVASRGEYLTTYDSYLNVFNAADLSSIISIDTINGPKWATQNLVVDGNNVYVAVNNGYEWGNEKGIIGRLDMTTLTYGNEIDLGPDGKNPDNLVLSNGYLYTVNNKDWTGSSISKISLDGSLNQTVNIAAAGTGCGTSALRDGKMVYQISMESVLNEFDINGMNNVGPLAGFDQNYYELAQEPVSGYLYTSVTDFFSTGEVRVYDGNSLVSSFAVGVSPGTIVFDVRALSSVQEENTAQIAVYPNHVTGELHVDFAKSSMVNLSDATGRTILAERAEKNHLTFDLSALPSGYYFCTVIDDNGVALTRRISKL